mgnify:CR=1 FL=1
MIEFEQKITDPLGLHARPVALLFDHIGKHRSRVTLTIGDRTADGRDIMGLMGLYGEFGETLHVTVEGEDEAVCAADLRQLVANLESEL